MKNIDNVSGFLLKLIVNNYLTLRNCQANQMVVKAVLLPLVSLYISRTVCVDSSRRGLPLRPPVSCLCLLCNDSGRDVVVLHTIRPSTLH